MNLDTIAGVPRGSRGSYGALRGDGVAVNFFPNGRRMPKIGALQVWWIPQVPMDPFTVDIGSLKEGVMLLDALARYDLFQLKHRIKPDFCNAGGIRVWCADDGSGVSGWNDWFDEKSGEDDPRKWLEEQADRVEHSS